MTLQKFIDALNQIPAEFRDAEVIAHVTSGPMSGMVTINDRDLFMDHISEADEVYIRIEQGREQ